VAGKAKATETADEGPPGGLIVQINGLLPALSPAEQRVARIVLADPADAARHTITDLSAAANTSEASVVRFCRSIGLTGYPQLRIRLAAEAARRIEPVDASVAEGAIHPGAHLTQIIATVAFNDARAVEETAQQLDPEVCEQIVHALLKANRIEVFGAGASGFVAADFQAKLHRLGRVAYYWPDVHGTLASAAMLSAGDVAFGISHTGTTWDTIEMLTRAREAGATTVALTNFPRSKISEAADLVVTTAARETTYRSGALASRLAQLTVLDCLFVALAARTRGKAGRAFAASEGGHGRVSTGKREKSRGNATS
jgi:DNA-binding MurR/RpiR family transcriptional regulator